MADEEKKSSLDRVLDELRDPWDWVAAFIGGAVGALLSLLIHKFDLDHAIPTGALFGIGGRRAIVSAFARRELTERADALKDILRVSPVATLVQGPDLLSQMLEDATTKWRKKVFSNQTFDDWLTRIAAADSRDKKGDYPL